MCRELHGSFGAHEQYLILEVGCHTCLFPAARSGAIWVKSSCLDLAKNNTELPHRLGIDLFVQPKPCRCHVLDWPLLPKTAMWSCKSVCRGVEGLR